MSSFSGAGKVSSDFFESSIYPFCGSDREEVIVPPSYGVDVALVRLPNGYEMALTSDPLSLIPTLGLQESAWLSVQLIVNDMVTTGVAPMYAQFVLNLPPSINAAEFDEYWKYIHDYCKYAGIAITGGHTGKCEGQNSTVAGGGTMTAIAPEGTMLTSSMAEVGDVVIVTKESAQIATSILALSFPKTVNDRCGQEVQQKAAELFYNTSSLEAGLAVAALNKKERIVTAMHDVTEGGICGAIYELAVASGCGVEIAQAKLPTGDVQQQVCSVFGIDPHYCVGAGSMIVTAKRGKEHLVIEELQRQGIIAVAVGVLTEKSAGMSIRNHNGVTSLTHPGVDPYWAAFYDAMAKGLK